LQALQRAAATERVRVWRADGCRLAQAGRKHGKRQFLLHRSVLPLPLRLTRAAKNLISPLGGGQKPGKCKMTGRKGMGSGAGGERLITWECSPQAQTVGKQK